MGLCRRSVPRLSLGALLERLPHVELLKVRIANHTLIS